MHLGDGVEAWLFPGANTAALLSFDRGRALGGALHVVVWGGVAVGVAAAVEQWRRGRRLCAVSPGLAVAAEGVEAPSIQACSFVVERGARVAVVGGNGSGKTALLEMLAGVRRPRRGRLAVDIACWPLGFAPDDALVPLHDTPRSLLTYLLRLQGAPRPAAGAEAALERFRLAKFADQRCGSLSLGARRLLILAQAQLGEPGLLVLDEPTGGLDGDAEAAQHALLAALPASVTLFVSAHALAELRGVPTHSLVLERECRPVWAQLAAERVPRAAAEPPEPRATVPGGGDRAGVEPVLEANLHLARNS